MAFRGIKHKQKKQQSHENNAEKGEMYCNVNSIQLHVLTKSHHF